MDENQDQSTVQETVVEKQTTAQVPDQAGPLGNVTAAVTGQPVPAEEKVTVTERTVEK